MGIHISLDGADALKYIQLMNGQPTPAAPALDEDDIVVEEIEPVTETPTADEIEGAEEVETEEVEESADDRKKRLRREKAAQKRADKKAAEGEDPPEPDDDPQLDVDALRERFEQLVIDDYDAAVALIDGLEVDNFQQAIGAGMEKEVAAALAEHV